MFAVLNYVVLEISYVALFDAKLLKIRFDLKLENKVNLLQA